MNRLLSALLVLATLLIAGCIELPADPNAPVTSQSLRLPAQSGTMTAEESVEESENLCLGNGPISLPELPIYCATRITTVTGEMTLTSLPFEVFSDTGDVEIVPSEDGVWSLVFTVTAGGTTPQTARARLENTEIAWSIDGESGHEVHASATHPDNTGFANNRVLIRLALPSGALYAGFASTSTGDISVNGFSFETLTATASTGDIRLEDIRASFVHASASTGDVTLSGAFGVVDASASTGDIDVDAEFVDAAISTSTGDITARLTPTASGRITLGASTGDVKLMVPENPARGYDLEADTSTGDITITLKDGDVSVSEDRDKASFTTSGLARRAIRTTVTIGTSTGDVTVTPA